MSGLYAHRKYKINPKLRAIIEAKLGKQLDLMNHQLDLLIWQVCNGEYTSLVSPLSDTDKEKIIIQLKDKAPLTSDDKKNKAVADFLKENFDQDRIDDYINHCITTIYKPGMLVQGLRVNTKGIVDFLDTMLVDMVMGFVINKNYMNDALNIIDIDESEPHDTKSLLAIKDLSKKYRELKKKVTIMSFSYVYENDDLLVIATDDLTTFDSLKELINLDDCLIPKEYFKWGTSDFSGKPMLGQTPIEKEEELSETDKADQLISKNTTVITPDIIIESVQSEEYIEPTINKSGGIIPPDAPRQIIFESTKSIDLFLNGEGYINGIKLTDDESSISVVHNNSKVIDRLTCDGGVVVTELNKITIDNLKEYFKTNSYGAKEAFEYIEHYIISNFVGKVNLVVEFTSYDQNDKPTIEYLDPSTIQYDHLMHPFFGTADEDKYDDFDVSVILEIDGTYNSIDKMTYDMYKNY